VRVDMSDLGKYHTHIYIVYSAVQVDRVKKCVVKERERHKERI